MRNTLESAGISRPVVTMPNFVPEPQEAGEPIYHFPYFLFVGLLEEHKGALNLVEAFCQAKEEIDANLLIVGSGSLKDRLHQIIAQNSCQSRVKLLGKISDRRVLTNLYTNALALVIPSIWPENAPLVALEALACGTPVITSDKGGLPEIAGKVDPSLIFKDELRSILRQIGIKPKPRQKEVYEQFYSPKGFMEAYSELIAGR
jgi:glycosyltransferase involved in cell wall biosynthesis